MTAFGDFDAIDVGDSAFLDKSIEEADIRRFVEMTGDDNPLHVDPDYAETTPFKDIVVHGMLGASFISTIIGTKLPGRGALWVSQSMEFLLPVRLGDTLRVTATVTHKVARERLLKLETNITNQHGKEVLRGEGTVKVLKTKEVEVQVTRDTPRVAIVTGGAGGIGRAICRRLAADGHHVVINYRKSASRAAALAEELNAGPCEALAVQADISTSEGIDRLVDATMKRFGHVSVLVNNASPPIHSKRLAELDWAEIQQHLDVQSKSSFLLAKACAPSMETQQSGRIISITSQALEGSPTVGWTAYAIAKSALTMMMRYLAAELGPTGVTVNCVAPGMTETRLIGNISEKVQLVTARNTPTRRLAKPEDVAAAVAYLASDDAAHITGETLRVNGGMAMS